MEMLSTLRAEEHQQKLSTETGELFADVNGYFLSLSRLGLQSEGAIDKLRGDRKK